MRSEIKSKSVTLPSDIGHLINATMADTKYKVTPFLKLFWQQQQSAFAKKNGGKYHPMIIRFCLSLAKKSGLAYGELRHSNVLLVPSRRTL